MSAVNRMTRRPATKTLRSIMSSWDCAQIRSGLFQFFLGHGLGTEREVRKSVEYFTSRVQCDFGLKSATERRLETSDNRPASGSFLGHFALVSLGVPLPAAAGTPREARSTEGQARRRVVADRMVITAS